MPAIRSKGLSAYALWSACSAGLLLAAFTPAPLVATNDPAPPRRISHPTLKSGDCTLAVRLDNADPSDTPGLYRLTPGQRPQFTIGARNNARVPRTARYVVRVHATSPASPLSRVPSIPRPIWTSSDSIVLTPGEKRLITLHPEFTPAPGTNYTIELSDGGTNAIRPLAFVLAPNAPATPTVSPEPVAHAK